MPCSMAAIFLYCPFRKIGPGSAGALVHVISSGVPLNMLQKWMGHADIATTVIYANALGPEEQPIAERMWS